MSIGPDQGLHGVGAEELRRSWGWFLGVGIVVIILGLIALAHTAAATIFSVVLIGWLLLFSGILSVVHAFLRRRWGGFFLELLAGILYFVVGLMLIANPAEGAAALTLVIAVALLVGGIFRIVTAFMVRFHHWGWMLLNGVISVLLGLMIWGQWPLSAPWVIGLFLGIDLIFYGWSLVMLGLTVKGLPERAA